MIVEELYRNLNNNQIKNSCYIFKETTDYFLSIQYTKAIAEISGLNVLSINNIETFNDNNSYLYVLETNVLDFNIPTAFSNSILIIICGDILPNIQKQYAEYITILPILKDWQKKDYILAQLPKLTFENVESLFKNCQGNMNKIYAEINRLKIYSSDNINAVYKMFCSKGVYNYFNEETIFDLIDACLTKNLEKFKIAYSNYISTPDKDFSVVLKLLEYFRAVIIVQGSKTNYKQISIDGNIDFEYIYNSMGYYTLEELRNIFNLLIMSIAQFTPTDFSHISFLDLIICKLFV